MTQYNGANRQKKRPQKASKNEKNKIRRNEEKHVQMTLTRWLMQWAPSTDI